MTDTRTDLERYGDHTWDCPARNNQGPCTCGLDDAVERAREELASDQKGFEDLQACAEGLADERDALRAQLAEARGALGLWVEMRKTAPLNAHNSTADWSRAYMKAERALDAAASALSSAPTEPATAAPGKVDRDHEYNQKLMSIADYQMSLEAPPRGLEIASSPTVPRSVAEGLYEALALLAKEANDVLTDHVQDEIEDPCGHADRRPWARIHEAALESLKPSVVQARAALEAARKVLEK